MAEVQNTPKRTRDQLSSVSDADSPLMGENGEKLTNKQRRKLAKVNNKKDELGLDLSKPLGSETNKETKETKETNETTETKSKSNKNNGELGHITKQLNLVNEKLNEVIKRQDTSVLKALIRDTLMELKDVITKTLAKQVEVLEGDVHDQAVENNKLRSEISDLKSQLNTKAEETEKLEQRIEKETEQRVEVCNDHEQYSRRKNVRVMELAEDHKHESSFETINKVVGMINTKLKLPLIIRDIDNAHRLGPYVQGRNRQVIVKFVNRHIKNRILAARRTLKGSGIRIYEDLTRLNNEVLASARKKAPDEVSQAWSRDGKLFVKWKSSDKANQITFKDYQSWLELPWPATNPVNVNAAATDTSSQAAAESTLLGEHASTDV